MHTHHHSHRCSRTLTRHHSSTRFTCGGCGLHGSGYRYSCHHCDFHLHEFCMTCSKTTEKFEHHGHHLTYRHSVTHTHRHRHSETIECHHCRFPIRGAHYHCDDGCDFRVHPTCARHHVSSAHRHTCYFYSLYQVPCGRGWCVHC